MMVALQVPPGPSLGTLYRKSFSASSMERVGCVSLNIPKTIDWCIITMLKSFVHQMEPIVSRDPQHL
jgi:hypothetical protein